MAGSISSPLCYRRALVALQRLLPDSFLHLGSVESTELSLPEINSLYSSPPPQLLNFISLSNTTLSSYHQMLFNFLAKSCHAGMLQESGITVNSFNLTL